MQFIGFQSSVHILSSSSISAADSLFKLLSYFFVSLNYIVFSWLSWEFSVAFFHCSFLSQHFPSLPPSQIISYSCTIFYQIVHLGKFKSFKDIVGKNWKNITSWSLSTNTNLQVFLHLQFSSTPLKGILETKVSFHQLFYSFSCYQHFKSTGFEMTRIIFPTF